MLCSNSSYVEVSKAYTLNLAKSQAKKVLSKRVKLRSERIDHHLKSRREWNSWVHRLRFLVPFLPTVSECREDIESSIEQSDEFAFYYDDNYASEIAEACDAVAKLCDIAAGESVFLSSYHLNELTKTI